MHSVFKDCQYSKQHKREISKEKWLEKKSGGVMMKNKL